jgi:DUF1365 family protein
MRIAVVGLSLLGAAALRLSTDRLDETDRMSRLFAVGRPALSSFHQRDFGSRDGASLRAFAQRVAAAKGIDLTGGRVTFKIMVAIHWQALRLWRKGAKLAERPSLEATAPAFVRTGQSPD